MAAAAPPPTPNLFGYTQWDGLTSFFGDQNFEYDGYILPQAAGWIVIILFGFIFALLAVFLVWVDIKFAGAVYNSEQFNTAGRSIGTGLLAVDIVSHWTWASILLQSASYGYFYGTSGSYWYSVNDAVIIVLFAVVALELKWKAPKAHTLLELVYVRWGRVAHVVFFVFAVVTNLLVSLSMLQGCVSAVNALTGVNVYAMSFLIPIGVVCYVAIGGLKATFTTSYMHTVIIYIICLVLMFKVFTPSDMLGGIDNIYDRLQQMTVAIPAVGNKDGSYLTAFSSGGLQFEIIFFFSAAAQMLVDQAYWQSAIAARASCAVKGYFLASFLYLGIVFSLPVCMGLATLAFDLPVSNDEALGGLVLPAAAYVVLGKAGAVLIIVIVFMAVTSSGASEMVAISSLFTFDVYRRYIDPKASGGKLVTVSRISVCVWAIIMGCAMSIAQAATINVNWLITIIGVIVGGAVPPLACLLLWKRCTAAAAISGAIIGSACGIASWLACAQIMSGEISIITTGLNPPLLTGNIFSVGISTILVVVISLIFPGKGPFQWELYKERITTAEDTVKKAGALDASAVESEAETAEIARFRRPTVIAVIVIFIAAMIVWPLLMLPAGDFSLGYFRFYVVLAFIILIIASVVGIVYPIWEARDLIAKFLTGNTFQELIEKSFHGSSRGGSRNPSVKGNKAQPPKTVTDSAYNGNALDGSADAKITQPAEPRTI